MKENTNPTRSTTARLASMIGMCRRANRLGCGTEAVQGALKTGRACIVLLAADPSDRTRKQMTDKCAFYRIPLLLLPLTKEELGRACGMDVLSACAVMDPQFARAVTDLAGTP
jgi:ribosomal protein L7Ae-like RNA K-turn-binding protein